MPSSRESSQPRDQTWVSCIAGRFFTPEPPGKPILHPSENFKNIFTLYTVLKTYIFYLNFKMSTADDICFDTSILSES